MSQGLKLVYAGDEDPELKYRRDVLMAQALINGLFEKGFIDEGILLRSDSYVGKLLGKEGSDHIKRAKVG